ILPNSFYVYL
ncbi:UBN2 domain-containing protein, partial [Cephalotus follicularis]